MTYVVENTDGEFVATFATELLARFFIEEGTGHYRFRPTPPAEIAAVEWQPIETAPRDGTRFDVWVPSATGGYRVADLRFNARGDLTRDGIQAKNLARWPTHWRALPEGPGDTSAAVAGKRLASCPTPWCPCDEKPYVWQGADDRYTVICGTCQVEGRYCTTEQGAIEEWHNRPAEIAAGTHREAVAQAAMRVLDVEGLVDPEWVCAGSVAYRLADAFLALPSADTPSDTETASLREALIDCGQQLKAANEALSASATGTEVARLREHIADLEASVIAFGAPWAMSYAKTLGLPDGHLHPTHYDILAFAGARMDDFTRAALSPAIAADAREGE